MQQLQHGNGQTGQPTPRDELEMQSLLLQQSQSNPLLKDTNLGQGNYDESYLWQQIRSYRKGLYTYIAFGRILTARAVEETKAKLGREGFTHYNEDRESVQQWDPVDLDDLDEETSSWTAVRERGAEIWRELSEPRQPLTEKQAAAIMDKANIGEEWLPVYWQMVSGRHEASRSKDAELLRDMLTGIRHLRDDAEGEASSLLLGGRHS